MVPSSVVPSSVVPSSAVPVSAVPASTLRMRRRRRRRAPAGGTQHLPSEERNGRGRRVRVTRAGTARGADAPLCSRRQNRCANGQSRCLSSALLRHARRRGQCCAKPTRCHSRTRDGTTACTRGAASILAARVRAWVRGERCTWLLVSTRRPALARGLHGQCTSPRCTHTQNLRRQSAKSARRAGQSHARASGAGRGVAEPHLVRACGVSAWRLFIPALPWINHHRTLSANRHPFEGGSGGLSSHGEDIPPDGIS